MRFTLIILLTTTVALKVVQGNEYENSPSAILLVEDDEFYNEVKSGVKDKSRGSFTYTDEKEQDDGSYDGKYVDNIPGVSGKDFPSYTEIPKTSFSCKGRRVSGYYADVETSCQVFHICLATGHKISFLCPKGSVFNQKVLVCDWWYDVDCYTSNDVAEFAEEILKEQFHQNQDLLTYNNFDEGYDLNLASSGGNEHPKKETAEEKEVKEEINKESQDKPERRIVKSRKIAKV